MKQSELLGGVYKPLVERPFITRRMGDKPSHINCGCPNSWTSLIEPHADGHDVRLAIEVEPQPRKLSADERDNLTSQVKRLNGSGGLAPYEDFGIVSRRGNLALSIAAACMQTGVVMLPDGGIQSPLFVIPDPMPPFRWNLEALPSIQTET